MNNTKITWEEFEKMIAMLEEYQITGSYFYLPVAKWAWTPEERRTVMYLKRYHRRGDRMRRRREGKKK